MSRFGKTEANGSQTQPTECVLTGRPVDVGNSVREAITGTPFFYRVLGSAAHRVTDELREQWKAEALKQDKAVERPVRVKAEENS